MLYLITAVTYLYFRPMEELHGFIRLAQQKKAFFFSVCLLRHHNSSSMRKSELLLTNPLPVLSYSFCLFPNPEVLLLWLPLYRYGPGLFLSLFKWLSTRFSFTLTDIKFYLSFHWSVEYTCTSLRAIILLLLSEPPPHLTGPVFCDYANTFVLTAHFTISLFSPYNGKQENMWRESSFHLQDWLFNYQPII